MTEPISQAVLSAELDGIECHTPHAVRSGDTIWAAWQGYHQNEERIFARPLYGNTLSPLETITPQGGKRHSPHMGLVQGVPTCVWVSEVAYQSYTVVGSTRSIAGWDTPQRLGSRDFAVSLHADSAHGRMAVVWCEAASPGAYAIRLVVNDGSGWSVPLDVTSAPGWVQRPEVAVASDGYWVAWDAYTGGTFGIHCAFVDRGGSVVEREVVSNRPAETAMVTDEAWQLVPSLTLDVEGNPWIAWLCRQEVISDTNVLDQWPVARVAKRVDGQWQLVCDSDGSPDLGVLAWGMLEWQGLGVWGYLGRRRKPLVVASPEGGVWLVWERKKLPNGSTHTTPGVLLGRYLDPVDGQALPAVRETRVVAEGPRYYTPVAGSAIDQRNELLMTARVAPEIAVEDVCLAAYSLRDVPAFQDEGPWFGWQPISLNEQRPRVQIREQSTAHSREASDEPGYQLFWADLHVHTTHSADAEGYVDELIAYARDIAQLDCVAFSDNDKHLLSLTSSEYDLDYHFVRHFRHLDDFVVLPAFEWSQMKRTDRGRTSNHRTVIAGKSELPLLRYTEVEGEPLAALAAHAEQHGAILHPHHEHWEFLSDSWAETNMEICSGWRVHMLDPAYLKKIHDVLRGGRKLGFIGCSDGHRRTAGTGGGLTGIYAESLTRTAIVEALQAHRCFATDGSRIGVQIWAAGVFMGGSGRTPHPPDIRWQAQLTETPAKIMLLRDGQVIEKWQATSEAASGRFTDLDAEPGPHFYYLWVEQSMGWRTHLSNVAPAWGPRAWSSPVWIEYIP